MRKSALTRLNLNPTKMSKRQTQAGNKRDFANSIKGKAPIVYNDMCDAITPKHYQFEFKGIKIDPYRIFRQYGIHHPAQQHAIKKLLRAGCSIKTLEKDIDEAIDTLKRWKEMIAEEKSL